MTKKFRLGEEVKVHPSTSDYANGDKTGVIREFTDHGCGVRMQMRPSGRTAHHHIMNIDKVN